MSRNFQAGSRFEILRRIGQGGFGTVYEAYDRDLGRNVALKTLNRAGASELYRFKQEFRALADMVHPNLVNLYELFFEGGEWFFTMEFVPGVNFLEYVKRNTAGATIPGTTVELASVVEVPPPPAGAATVEPMRPDRVPILRQAICQLTAGLSALHAAGHLHRDIKPSNVLVTPTGRVVILDFGLVAGFTAEVETRSLEIIGTPQYMSPEHVTGAPLSPASDWYSVGVMVYEVLTGRLPFHGTLAEIVFRKQTEVPPPPGSLASGVPQDLDELTCDLLHSDPTRRPSDAEIYRRLACSEVAAFLPSPTRQSMFVGRDQALRELEDAYRDVKRGRTVLVEITGPGGIGKSALVQKFLSQLQSSEPDALIFEGRCHERENVPYKALDKIVDGISRYLNRLPPEKLDALLPRDSASMARLFPVLERTSARFGTRARDSDDAHGLRRRGFAAMREFLGRLADRRPVVLFIDNAQWGDLDSASLLAEVLRPPDSPALLLIACFQRETGEEEAPFLAPIRRLEQSGLWDAEWRSVPLASLTPGEAGALAALLLGEASSQPAVDQIAHESGGNPLFIEVLTRHSQAPPSESPANLLDILRSELTRLPEPARQLIEVVAVAGRPVEVGVAQRATGPSYEEYGLAILRAERLVRWSSRAEGPAEIDVYHERIRQAALAGLSAEGVRHCHARLAGALESTGKGEPEVLFVHYQQAGERERAVQYALAAAHQASDALAFDRAASLYRNALQLGTLADDQDQEVRVHLAHALAYAGRGRDAAEAYFLAAERAAGLAQVDLRRRGAEQLLRSGYLSEGSAALHPILKSLGLDVPRNPLWATLAFLSLRIALAVRGTRFREREPNAIPGGELERIDACFAAALGTVGQPAGFTLHSRHVLWALRAGEPSRVARALGLDAVFRSLAASGGAEKMRDRAFALGEQTGNLHAVALAHLADGIMAWNSGQWRNGRERCERAIDILRANCADAVWESTVAESMLTRCLFYLGEIAEICRRVPESVENAQSRGDLFSANMLLTMSGYLYYLAHDRPDRARELVHQNLRKWESHGFNSSRELARLGLVEIALYAGDGPAAWDLAHQPLPLWLKIAQTRRTTLSVYLHSQRGRAALSRAAAEPARKDHFIAAAHKNAAKITRAGMAYTRPLAELLYAGAAQLRGEVQDAIRYLEQSEAGFSATGMSLHAAICRLRRGTLLGTGEGRVLLAEAEAHLRKQQIANVPRIAAMLAPGFDPLSNS